MISTPTSEPLLPPMLPALARYRRGTRGLGDVRWREEARALASCHTGVRSTSGSHELHARWGRGPDADPSLPAVLVHGYGVSSAYMVPLAVRLAPCYPVYAPDLPGHGRSPKPLHVLDVRDLADVLLAWMDAMGLERPALIGNSMGCQIVTDLAARHPGRVSRLVLIGPTTDASARTLPRHLARLIASSVGERLSLIPLLVADYARARPHRIWLEQRHMLADAIEERLPRIRTPTRVLHGALDAIAPEEWTRRITDLLPRARHHVVPGWGHALNHSAPLEVVRILEPFLRERGDGG